MIARVKSALRFARVEIAIVLAYAVARVTLGVLSEDDGLLTPGGAVKPVVLAVGALALLLRLAALFVVPAVLAYRCTLPRK